MAATMRERPLPDVAVGDHDVQQFAVVARAGDGDPDLPDDIASALADLGLDVAQICADAGFAGRAGAVLAIPLPTGNESRPPALAGARRLILVGIGAGATADLRRAGAGLARAATKVDEVGIDLTGQHLDGLQAFLTGLLVAAHAPIATGTKDRPAALGRLRLRGVSSRAASSVSRVVASALNAARATWLARDLSGAPSLVKNPAWLARTATQLARRAPVEVTVLGPRELAAHGFGGILAVGRASATPPRLVTVEYRPNRRNPRHVVLVGKGVTYDTGGLSLKPGESMVPMRTDMTGSAVVLATVLGAARAEVPHRVTAVLGLAENAIGAAAYRPGDVLTMWNGRTVEIANTDAEGRLVLADAMSWAASTYSPDVLVDVATLTGAATLGLGRRHAALFATDDSLADELVRSGTASGENLWRLPLVGDYRPAVRSPIADLAHVPGEFTFGGGGAITAALFLQEFTAGAGAWAHLDIAGPARADGTEHEIGKGPTGFGARLLLDWLST